MNEDVGQLKRIITQLQSQLSRLESASRQTWVYHSAPLPLTFRPITIKTTTNNKSLGYGSPVLHGAVWNATPFDTGANALSSAYDPNSETAITDDGIAYGHDDSTGNSVLIINRGVSGASTGILSYNLAQSCVFLAYRQISVPVSGGASVLAWEAYWG